MKKEVKWFVAMELLDIITTVIFMFGMGIPEANKQMASLPFYKMFLIKIYVIFFVATFIQLLRFPKWATTIMILIPSLTVVWNIFVMVVEVLYLKGVI